MTSQATTQANTTHVRELVLFITNDGELYSKHVLSILANLKKKLAKGAYVEELALISWYALATEGAKKYAKEFGGNWQLFTVADRKEAAKELAECYDEQLREA
jgi:hypothetical protein